MDKHYLASLSADLAKAFWETFQMVGISLAIAVAVGVPMGLFLYVTSRDLRRARKEMDRNGISPLRRFCDVVPVIGASFDHSMRIG